MSLSGTIEQIAELARLGATANPFDYAQQAILIEALRPLGDTQRIRAARVACSRNLVLPISEWQQWISEEVTALGTTQLDFVECLFYCAIEDWPAEASTHLHLAAWLSSLPAGFAAVASASAVLEKATEVVGCHPTAGPSVWRALIDNRKSALGAAKLMLQDGTADSDSDSDSESIQRGFLTDAIQALRAAYRIALQAPLAGVDDLLTEYLAFEAVEGLDGPAPISQAALDATAKHVLNSKAKLEHRSRFETDLARLHQEAGHDIDFDGLIHIWKGYIASCKSVSGKKDKKPAVLFDDKFIWQLFHRAVMDCRDDGSLWDMFLDFAAEMGVKEVAAQYQLDLLAIRRGVWTSRPLVESILRATAMHMNPHLVAGCSTYVGCGESLFSGQVVAAFPRDSHHHILERLVGRDGCLTMPMSTRLAAMQGVDLNLASIYPFLRQATPMGCGTDPENLLKQLMASCPNVAVFLHGLALISRHATDAVSIPLTDVSIYLKVLKAAIGSFCRMLKVLYVSAATEPSKQDTLTQLIARVATAFVAHFLQVFLHYYPTWDEGRYLLQSHFAHVAFEVLDDIALSEEAFDACLVYRGTDAPLGLLGSNDSAKHVITDPIRLFSAYQDAVLCARAQRRYSRCADLFRQMLHRFSTAKLHAPDMSPTPFDMVSTIVDAWEEFAFATGHIDEAIEAVTRGAVRRADVLRRQVNSAALPARSNDDKDDAKGYKRTRGGDVDAADGTVENDGGNKPTAKRARHQQHSNGENDNSAPPSASSSDLLSASRESAAAPAPPAESEFAVTFRRPKSSGPLKADVAKESAMAHLKEAHADDPLEPCTIYVWNLPFSDTVSRPTLQAEFGRFGKIVDARAILGAGKVCKGFGWVKFDNEQSMQDAIFANQSVIIGGRPVGIAQAKHSQVYPAFLFRAKPASTAEHPAPDATAEPTGAVAGTLDPVAPVAPHKRVSALSFVPRASQVKK